MKAVRFRPGFVADLDALRDRLGAAFEIETLAYYAELMSQGQSLPAGMHDHPLREELQGFRDFHIDPDWVVIYRETSTEIVFHRTGRHIDVFTKRLTKTRR